MPCSILSIRHNTIVSTKYKEKVNDVCRAYVDIFNQDAVGLLITNPMQFITKEVEVF